jgi:hypothetical protein
VEVIEAVDSELKKPIAHYENIAYLFEKEYDSSAIVGRRRPLGVNGIAIRYYAEKSILRWKLHDLLDYKYIYQPEYDGFKYIFFVNNDALTSRLTGASVLAEKSHLTESVIVEPLDVIDGFVPYVNGQQFTKKISAFAGEIIEVEWQKNGYRSIHKRFKVGEPKDSAMISSVEYEKFLSPESIVLLDKSTKQDVKNARICVQGKVLPAAGMYIPEYQFERSDIFVEHPDYEIVRLSNQNLNNTILIYLENKVFAYNFRMKLKNGVDVDFKVPSQVVLSECPVEGYKLRDESKPRTDITNRILYNPASMKFLKRLFVIIIVSFLVGLLAGAGAVFAIGKFTDIFKTKVESLPPRIENASGKNDVNKKLEAAVKYLDENNKWNKVDMEKHAPLIGLWDALNTWNFDEVLSSRYESLEKSSNFKLLKKEIKNNREKNRRDQNFNSPGDEVITLEKYTNALKRALPPATTPPQPNRPSSPNSSSQGNDGVQSTRNPSRNVVSSSEADDAQANL